MSSNPSLRPKPKPDSRRKRGAEEAGAKKPGPQQKREFPKELQDDVTMGPMGIVMVQGCGHLVSHRTSKYTDNCPVCKEPRSKKARLGSEPIWALSEHINRAVLSREYDISPTDEAHYHLERATVVNASSLCNEDCDQVRTFEDCHEITGHLKSLTPEVPILKEVAPVIKSFGQLLTHVNALNKKVKGLKTKAREAEDDTAHTRAKNAALGAESLLTEVKVNFEDISEALVSAMANTIQLSTNKPGNDEDYCPWEPTFSPGHTPRSPNFSPGYTPTYSPHSPTYGRSPTRPTTPDAWRQPSS